jgi:hypothetical protein
MHCRKRLLQMPELEREMELTRRKESQDDAELLKQLAKKRKGDAANDASESEVPAPRMCLAATYIERISTRCMK